MRLSPMRSESQQQILVLHVDDDPSVTDLTGRFLEREDNRFSVETAISATGGLERIIESSQPPDCVVSDYDMPEMDGIDFLQTVREEYPNLPFILFTGKGSEEIASDAISAGVTDYLQKQPGTEQYELLTNRIQNAVQTQHQRHRAERTDELMRLTEFAGDTGGFEINVDTGEVLMTDGCRRLVGLADDATLSLKEAIKLYHPDDQPEVRQAVNRAADTGEQTQGSWRLQALDNTDRIVDVTLTPAIPSQISPHPSHSMSEGKTEDETETDITILRGAIHDVTDSHQREQQLTELNRVSKDLLTAETQQEVVDIGVTAARDVLDFQANALHLSVSETGDTQLVPVAQTDELMSLLDEVPTLSVSESIAGRAYQRGEPDIIEDARQHPNAHNPTTNLRGHVYFPLAEHGILIAGSTQKASFDDQDLAVGELLAGALVAALDRLDREQTARRRAKELSLFFEESPLGAVQWDDKCQFKRVNRQAEEILGYSESELRGESWELIVADTDLERVGNAVDSFLNADGGSHIINSNVTKAGETLTCEWHNRVVTDADGTVQSVFSSFEDISARKQRRTELQEYKQELEAQNERLAEFTGIVSHDLRNPLAVAEGHLELAMTQTQDVGDNYTDGDANGNHIIKARHAIERCQRLIEDLLTLARDGDRVDDIEPIRFDTMIEECWETVETTTATLTIADQRSHSDLYIKADKSRLKQLLENLYRNAVEHGGDQVIVSAGIMSDGFYVSDTGPGVPKSAREKIFNAGYSTAENGTGFGLRIVKQVADAHGWEIDVTNDTEQGGARFEFTGVQFVD